MSSQSLTITLQSTAADRAAATYWLRLVQEGVADDAATVEQAAALIDEVYQTDPCLNPDALRGSGSQASDEPPLERDAFAAIVRRQLALELCRRQPDGSVEVDVRVYRSHQEEPYRLVIEGGSVLATVQVREPMTVFLDLDGDDSLVVQYPFHGRPVATWISASGEAGPVAPTITWNGTTASFGQRISGALRLDFLALYDRATVRIDGDRGQPGEATALAFYHGLVEELQLEQPPDDDQVTDRSLYCGGTFEETEDEVECYRILHKIVRCRCSGEVLAEWDEEVTAECPSSVSGCSGTETRCRHLLGTEAVTVEYQDCGETTGDMGDPAFYLEKCCAAPGHTLPLCSEWRTPYHGGVEISGGALSWRNLYGPRTRLVPVAPATHGWQAICGDTFWEVLLNPINCCDEIEPIVINADWSGDILAPESDVRVLWSAGRSPFEVVVAGIGLFLDPQRTRKRMTTTGRNVTVYADERWCGTGWLTVSDGCTTAAHALRSTEGDWVQRMNPFTGTKYWPKEQVGVLATYGSGNYDGPTGEINNVAWVIVRGVLYTQVVSGYSWANRSYDSGFNICCAEMIGDCCHNVNGYKDYDVCGFDSGVDGANVGNWHEYGVIGFPITARDAFSGWFTDGEDDCGAMRDPQLRPDVGGCDPPRIKCDAYGVAKQYHKEGVEIYDWVCAA
jgi:hypothetical protein